MNTADNFVGPINLGNPREFTIKELAELILEKIDTKSKIYYKELPQDDPIMRCQIYHKQELNYIGA